MYAILFALKLTHWGRVTHIIVSKLNIIGSDNALSPGRHQAIIRTNRGILLIGYLGTNLTEILIEILTLSFKKMCSNMPSAKWLQCVNMCPSCSSLSSPLHFPYISVYLPFYQKQMFSTGMASPQFEERSTPSYPISRVTSHECHDITNHRQIDRLFTGEIKFLHDRPSVRDWWLRDSPYKGPILKKAFWSYDIMMCL